MESLSPLKCFPVAPLVTPRRAAESLNPALRTSCCPQCKQNYEQELAKFIANENEKSSSNVKSEGAQPSLPQWLQDAKVLGDVKTLNQAQVS